MEKQYYVLPEFAEEFLGFSDLNVFDKIEINVVDGKYIESAYGIRNHNATDFGFECTLGNGALEELEEAYIEFLLDKKDLTGEEVEYLNESPYVESFEYVGLEQGHGGDYCYHVKLEGDNKLYSVTSERD